MAFFNLFYFYFFKAKNKEKHHSSIVLYDYYCVLYIVLLWTVNCYSTERSEWKHQDKIQNTLHNKTLHHQLCKSTLTWTIIFSPVPESQDKKWLLLTTQVTQSIVTQWLSDSTEKSHLRSNSVTTRITLPPTTKYHTPQNQGYQNHMK